MLPVDPEDEAASTVEGGATAAVLITTVQYILIFY